MELKHIRLELAPLASVTLTRPEARNAMSEQTLRELSHAFGEIAGSPKVRAVLIRGVGKDFCAGADIEWLRRAGKLPPAEGRRDAMLLADMLRAVDECPVPVIARAQGAVFGGGLGLVSVCDLVVAADDAKMCFSEARLGILPAVISAFVLPRIGAAAARRYYLTAEVFGMAQAKQMGLVTDVAPEAELDARVDAIVASILRCGPQALREAKALIRRMPGVAVDERLEIAVSALVRLRSSPEGQEGLSAFLEKRPAAWVPK